MRYKPWMTEMTTTDCRDPGFRMETERLILRRWREADLEPFAALNADPEVMTYLLKKLTIEESADLIDRMMERTTVNGFSFMPVEEKASGRFIGFVGLNRPVFATPQEFEPCIEIGWRLARWAWGKGYASEAARAWLGFGFETIGLDEIVAFTVLENARSFAVMQRLGMREERLFDHPAVPESMPHLRTHRLCSLSRDTWLRQTGAGLASAS